MQGLSEMHGIERLKHSPETSVSVVFIISFSSFFCFTSVFVLQCLVHCHLTAPVKMSGFELK